MNNMSVINFDEYYAKLLLEKLFIKEYNSLYLSDRPDICDQSNSMGVEVTDATPQSDQHWIAKESLKMCGSKKFRNISSKTFKVLVQSNKINNVSTSSKDDQINFLYRRIQDKIDKLNKGLYNRIPCVDLFVFTPLSTTQKNWNEIFDVMLSINSREKNYRYIYIHTYDGILYRINSKKHKVKHYNIHGIQKECAYHALNVIAQQTA